MRAIKPINEDNEMICSPRRPEGYKKEPIYPRVELRLEDIPEAKKWELGQEATIVLKVKMSGISQNSYSSRADFELREIEVKEGKDKD